MSDALVGMERGSSDIAVHYLLPVGESEAARVTAFIIHHVSVPFLPGLHERGFAHFSIVVFVREVYALQDLSVCSYAHYAPTLAGCET